MSSQTSFPRLLRVPGASLYIEDVGPADATPVFVVHGGPGEAHDYLRPHLDGFATPNRRVIYYDQRGSGRSPLDAQEPFADASTHVRDLDCLRQHLSCDQAVLVGFSWGALLALLYALQHPHNVSRLVLVSPVPVFAAGMEVVGTNLALAARRPEVQAFLQHHALGPDPHVRFWRTIAPCFFDPQRVLSVTPVASCEEAAHAAMRSLGDFDLRARLGSLAQIPSLVVYGAEDPVSAPFASLTADALDARCVALERAGHAPFVEAQEAFLREITRFLDEQDRVASV